MADQVAGSIPASADQIDASWLETALARRHPGVRVASVEVRGRAEVTNAHARLTVDYHDSVGLPEELFVKMLPSAPGHREAIRQTNMGLREALFYERLAPGLSLRVPRVHAIDLDEQSGEFILVMENLEAAGCTISSGPESVAIPAARRALEDLARMHVRFEDPSRRGAEAGWVLPPDPPSDYAIVRLRQSLAEHRDRLSDAFAEMSSLYIEAQSALHALWHPGPQTIIHGDAHIGNLFDDAGRTGFLDWGLIVASTPLRDLSYFLCMALGVEDRRQHERDLIDHYLEARLAARGEPISGEEAWKQHRLQAAYLAPACCQIVMFPSDITPRRERFANAFLARAEAAIEDLECRDALRRYAGL